MFLVYFLQDWINTLDRDAGAPDRRVRVGRRPGRPAGASVRNPATIARMFERTALPAGPRVISARLPAARSVSIAAYVLAGSRLETAGQAGVAHFMEHLTFKGTTALSRRRAPISEAIEGVGGSFNAATDRESTVYWVRVPRREADARDGRPRRADRPAAARRRRHRERADGHHRGDPLVPRRPVRVLPDPVPDGDVRRRPARPRDLRRGGRHPGPARGRHPRLLADASTGRPTRSSRSPATSATTRRSSLAGDGVRDRQRRRSRATRRRRRCRPGRASGPASATPARRSSASASRRSIATIPTAGRWPSSTRSSATG